MLTARLGTVTQRRDAETMQACCAPEGLTQADQFHRAPNSKKAAATCQVRRRIVALTTDGRLRRLGRSSRLTQRHVQAFQLHHGDFQLLHRVPVPPVPSPGHRRRSPGPPPDPLKGHLADSSSPPCTYQSKRLHVARHVVPDRRRNPAVTDPVRHPSQVLRSRGRLLRAGPDRPASAKRSILSTKAFNRERRSLHSLQKPQGSGPGQAGGRNCTGASGEEPIRPGSQPRPIAGALTSSTSSS